MKKTLLLLLSMAFALAGCKYDDSSVWDEINAQKAKIAALEGTVSSMNSNIGSLQSLVSAVQQKVTVNSVTKTENGYLIAFSDGNTARINNGANGADGKDGKDGQDGIDGIDGIDGSTPVIGAKADSDGAFYWTVNGEWMLDESGDKVPTSNTPKVKIEDDQWLVSYDGGQNWEKVEGQGASASCVFESVTTDAYSAIFTLGDGTVITVPLTNAARKLQLLFDESVFASMRNGELLSTAYEIVAQEDATVALETFESDGWTVVFHKTGDREGRISIKAPDKVKPTKILFLLTDDQGGSFVKIINIGLNESAKPTVQTNYSVDHKGGELTIPLVSSTATVDEEGSAWVKVVSVGEQVVLNISGNESYDWRTANVTLEDGTVISVTQLTQDAMILSKEVIEIDGRRQVIAFPVSTNLAVKAVVTEGSDWLTVTPPTRDLNERIFTFTAKRNTSEEVRTGKVEFTGNDLKATCTVIQAVYDGDPAYDVTEAAAADEGESFELRPSIIAAATTEGYVIADGGSFVYVKDASHVPQSVGDSVKFTATATKFNGMPALGSVQGFTKVADGYLKITGTDISSRLDSYSSPLPSAVKITGDFSVDKDGNCYLIVAGSTKKVLIYKPASFTGINETLVNHSVTVTGVYYGESNGTITVIATRKDDNGLIINDGDEVSIAKFISLADKSLSLKVGPALVVASASNGFLMEQDGKRIYVYNGKAKVGDNVTVTGKYSEYRGEPQVSSPSVSVNSSGNSVSYPGAKNINSSFDTYSDHTREYVTFTGELSVSGNYVNVTVDGATVKGSVNKPVEDLSSMENPVTIQGYYLYHTVSGQTNYLNVIATHINGVALVGESGSGGGGEGGGEGGEVSGNVETIDFSKQGFEDAKKYATVNGTYTTVSFGPGGNDGKFYVNGNAIRIYGSTSGFVQIESSKTITQIVYTFSGGSNAPAEGKYTVNTGSLTPGTTSTWTGSSKSVKLTNGAGSGHWRLQKVAVTYAE